METLSLSPILKSKGAEAISKVAGKFYLLHNPTRRIVQFSAQWPNLSCYIHSIRMHPLELIHSLNRNFEITDESLEG